MAKDFRHARFGLVPSDLHDSRMEANELILKAFLNAYNKFELLSNADSHQEVFVVAKEYFGDNFRNWLYVNFRMGIGARRELARKIVGYINGELSARSVTTQVLQDISFLKLNPPGKQMNTPVLYNEYCPGQDVFKIENVDFSKVENRHLADFFALLGPELTAKFILSIDGVYYG